MEAFSSIYVNKMSIDIYISDIRFDSSLSFFFLLLPDKMHLHQIKVYTLLFSFDFTPQFHIATLWLVTT